MRAILLCWFSLLPCIIVPSLLLGKIDYTKLDPDSQEVQQASVKAVKRLGPDRGAVAIEKRVIDIIGIPKGMVEAGVALTGHIEELEKAIEDLGAEVTETEIKVELPSDILFDFDKYNMRLDAQEALEKVAVVIRAYKKGIVLIEGHTDSKGSEEYNVKLSERRAESFKQWLQEKEDLKDTIFRTEGWGKSKPRATNETDEGRQKNRRVEIIIKK